MMDQKLPQIAEDFLRRIEPNLPAEKAERLFVVAMIGLIGSGRTTVAKTLATKIQGAISVQSNSVRYLLREAGMSWGENVRQVLKIVAKDLLARGYSVIFDGNAADEEDRKNIEEVAGGLGAKVSYVKINIDPEIAKLREQAKYNDSSWTSNFEDFRVNTTENMVKNLEERTELHKRLQLAHIPNLAGEVDNNGDLENLERQVEKIAENLKEG